MNKLLRLFPSANAQLFTPVLFGRFMIGHRKTLVRGFLFPGSLACRFSDNAAPGVFARAQPLICTLELSVRQNVRLAGIIPDLYFKLRSAEAYTLIAGVDG